MGNIRYRNEFYSIEGTLWKLDIIDTSYNGSVNELITTDPFFSLQYQGSKERFDPIIASELKVSALVQDADFETFISDIALSGENRFFAKLYKNTVFHWAGVLITDDIKIEDIAYPFVFEMSFTDGLGTLKDKLYTNESVRPFTLYTGKESLITMIHKALTHAGPGLNAATTIWSATDVFIKSCVHWYDAHQNFWANSDPLEYARVSHEAYHKEDNGVYTASSCYDVLYDILSLFGARIMLSEGSYKIIQVNEHGCPNQIWRKFRVTDGAYLGYVFESNNITSTDYDILTGRVYSFMPALLKATKKYKYNPGPSGYNLLPNKTRYETVTPFIGGVVGGDGEMLKFNGVVNQTITSPTSEVLSAPIRPYFWMTIKITKADNTVNYLKYSQVPGTAGWEYSWTATPTYMTYYGNYIFKIQTSQSFVFYIEFMSPPIPWDCTGSFEFDFKGFEQNGSAYPIGDLVYDYSCDRFTLQNLFPAEKLTSGELVNGNIYRINDYHATDDFTNVGAASNATGVEFRCTGEVPTQWVNGTEILNLSNPNASGVVEYISENLESGRSKVYKAKDAQIGDGYSGLSIGALDTSDGTTWINSTEWKVKKSGTGKRIHQLFTNEVISSQLFPNEIMTANFIAPSMTPDSTVVLADATSWVFMNGTFSGKNDSWTGEWFKVKNMTITEETELFLSKGEFSDELQWSLQAWTNTNYEETVINIPSKNSGGYGNGDITSSGTLKEVASTTTITEDSEIVIPSGNMIVLIAIKNVGVQFTVKLGYTSGGSEVFTDTLAASEIRSIPLHLLLSASADTTLYVTSANWTGAEISFYIKMEKIF